ncbi:hypothetical protein IV203_035754 [Nitzschia inconspicua]|uniref:Uncharacterized protein n=1 Tax=Nitzschia inconspicua TaxID=303405 RepID=A0A9K3PUV9_9STRA|nr:hypothetical protein IV203_035754 [Nitzschia inconspicua]
MSTRIALARCVRRNHIRLHPFCRNQSTQQQQQQPFQRHRVMIHGTSSPVMSSTSHRRWHVVPALQTSKQRRPFSSSSSSSSSSTAKPESSNKDPPTLSNLILASGLFGFVTAVFFYSMNSVGRADGDDDPLAQLKAEAHEALQDAQQKNKKKLTPEEIQALESGMSGGHDGLSGGEMIEMAVGAPADIAAIEEEANLKVFQLKNQPKDDTPKKPWWRFGF